MNLPQSTAIIIIAAALLAGCKKSKEEQAAEELAEAFAQVRENFAENAAKKAEERKNPKPVETIAGEAKGRLGTPRAEIDALWGESKERDDKEIYCEAAVYHRRDDGPSIFAYYWKGGLLGKVSVHGELVDESARAYLLAVGGGSWEVLEVEHEGHSAEYRRSDGEATARLSSGMLTIEAKGFEEYEEANKIAIQKRKASDL